MFQGQPPKQIQKTTVLLEPGCFDQAIGLG